MEYWKMSVFVMINLNASSEAPIPLSRFPKECVTPYRTQYYADKKCFRLVKIAQVHIVLWGYKGITHP